MIFDSKQAVPPDRADILIIGSGAAGITLALEMIGRPEKVVLLEAGGKRFDRTVQADYRATRVSPWTHFAGELGRRRAFGGTTSIWGGRCIPFDPVDYRARNWVPFSGWPIAHEDAGVHMPRAMDLLKAGMPEFTTAALQGDTAPLTDTPIEGLELDRIERFSLPLDFGRYYEKDLAAAQNVTCYLNTPVLRLLAEDGRVVGVQTPAGPIHAACVVLATGGIETARLLLASGLGGDNAGRYYQTHIRVVFGSMQVAQSARTAYQRSTDGVWCRRYIAFDADFQERHRLPQAVVRANNPPLVDPAHGSAILSLIFLVKGVLIDEYRKILVGHRDRSKKNLGYGWPLYARHLKNVVRGIGPLSLFFANWIRLRILPQRKLPSVFIASKAGRYGIDLQLEQAPNPDSRIALTNDTDAHGVPRIAIDWQPCAEDRVYLERVIAALKAKSVPGVLEFESGQFDPATAELFPVPSHHIGTARMAADPRDGVCDTNCEVFGTAGLYIASSAVFPTSGFANPTLLIVALTLRLAEYLKTQRPVA